MNRVRIALKNCYGIKDLIQTLDFASTPAYAIYAANGVMKSSLALTFRDAATGKPSEDRIFPERTTTRSITDDAGDEISGDRILVVGPVDEQFGPTEKTATLLVDAKLKKEYDDLHLSIDSAKAAFLKAIQEQGKSKRNFEPEISLAFTPSAAQFEDAVVRIRKEIAKQADAPLANMPYDVIFNDQVATALNNATIRDAIGDYITRYNQLLEASMFFKKGMFDYYNAAQIAKQLAENGFFDAKHTVTLRGATKTLEISSQKELESVVAEEKSALLSDKELRKRFEAVQKQLEKNTAVRELYRFLQENEVILSKMGNLPQLKESVLKSYIKAREPLYEAMMQRYEQAESRLKDIESEAKRQRTEWEIAIDKFNDRFFVPFRLEVRNRTEVISGAEPIIDLGFKYVDMDDSASATVDKPKLLQVLSTGERKAFYILNVLFEVERRKKAALETILIVDDIADSFDYQNKYAIIHYLKEISEDGLFKLVIMTHNFDFFRTLESRFIGYPFCLKASKNGASVSLVKAYGIRNIFANDWKHHFFDDPKKKIASVTFLRNLVEMTTGETDQRYTKLTSMVHWKGDTPTLTVADLDAIFNSLCNTSGTSPEPTKLICDLVHEQAKTCLEAPGGMNLENTILLAMATRLAAERFMIEKIDDAAFVAGINASQTQALIARFKNAFASEADASRVMDQVAIMTPENIHVNAFMYEPIVDMSDDHLRKLYRDVQALK